MKRLLPTIILVIVCIAGFWYASSNNFFKEKKDEPKQLFTVKKDDVTGFTIQNGDSTLDLQKKDGAWTMTKPSALPLNSYSPDSWVDSFNLASKDKQVEENASDLAKYGLDKPKQQFKVTMKDGSTKSILVGETVPIPGFSYAKTGDSNEVFRFAEQTITSLNKQQMDFMEKSPIKMNFQNISYSAMDWKGAKWSMTKKDAAKDTNASDWTINGKDMKGSDAEAILDKMIFMETSVMVKPASQVKMDAPEMRLELKEKISGTDTTSVYTGKVDGDNVWVVKQGGEWAYQIPTDSVQDLFDKGKNSPPAAATAPPVQSPGPVPPMLQSGGGK